MQKEKNIIVCLDFENMLGSGQISWIKFSRVESNCIHEGSRQTYLFMQN
jgi:hypothetical protein